MITETWFPGAVVSVAVSYKCLFNGPNSVATDQHDMYIVDEEKKVAW